MDVVDQMNDTYRTKVATLRWPMIVFYTIIVVAALNASIIWLHSQESELDVEHGEGEATIIFEGTWH
jgi:hypothetical protein